MIDDPRDGLARRFLRFAEQEARGRSPLYESFAREVAADPMILAFVAGLSADKQTANLLFGAVRYLHGTPADWEEFRSVLAARLDQVRDVILSHTTQTNEPARCATLLPLLARLPGPLALLEVGASAGLCLLPDRYAYDYDGVRIPPSLSSPAEPPVLRCSASPSTPLPLAAPDIVWRAGLDLNPIDLNDPERTAWLEALIWPGREERLRNLHAALDVARHDPPRIVRGNLLTDLPPLAAEAPSDATLVVFHTAVLAYVPAQNDRDGFARTVRDLGAVWISNESPRVFPRSAEKVSALQPLGHFLMMMNGEPVAWTDPHGAAIEWL